MKKPSSKEPKWKRNHWRLFEHIIHRADFGTDINALRVKRVNSKDALPLSVDKDFHTLASKHQVPPTCLGAFEFLVNYPEASEDDLKSRIISPVNWVYPSTKSFGPEQSDYMNYDMWQHTRNGYFGNSLLLEIRPFTKISELLDFIDENKSELDQLLQHPPYEAQLNYPESIGKRVDKVDYVGEEGLKLRDKGISVREAMKILDVDDTLDEANFRARVSRARERRSARNKKN